MRVRELRLTYDVVPGITHDNRRPLSSPREAARLLLPLLSTRSVEAFVLLALTTKHRLIGYHVVSTGTLDNALVHPREVFKAAILANAAAIIVAHNHPSGDLNPSAEDVALTSRLVEAGQLLGIPVLDHIIIADGRYSSFRENGRL